MQINIIEKNKIYIIGKMAQGVAENATEWIQELWNEANEHFYEIGNLAKLDKNGEFCGFWGAMSDIDELFLPWDWQGKYLAGCEVEEKAVPPKGWTKWTIPAFKYITVKCNNENYREVLNNIRNDYLPKHKYKLIGAIQEYYPPKEKDGSLYLYFPVGLINYL